jgi:hypothetical protein
VRVRGVWNWPRTMFDGVIIIIIIIALQPSVAPWPLFFHFLDFVQNR